MSYVILQGGTIWALALTTDDLEDREAQFDAIAASFDFTSYA